MCVHACVGVSCRRDDRGEGHKYIVLINKINAEWVMGGGDVGYRSNNLIAVTRLLIISVD
jgi:hypothetical protein